MKRIVEDIMFDVSYFFSNIRSNFRSFLQGIENLWKYKKLIWNDRWYDYYFIHEMLKFKLKDARDEWDGSHYVGSEYEKELLVELVNILEEIDRLEDECSIEADKRIDELYQKFGRLLFDVQTIKKINKEFPKGELKITGSRIRSLWD